MLQWFLKTSFTLAIVATHPAMAVLAQDGQGSSDVAGQPGVNATLSADGSEVERVDSQLNFTWPEGESDLRLPPGPFRSSWQALLEAEAKGTYQIAAYVQGRVQITLNGLVVLEDESEQAQWLESADLSLDSEFYDLSIDYNTTAESGAGRLTVLWRGPNFDWELIPPRRLWQNMTATPQYRHLRGQELVTSLQCNRCHEIPTGVDSLPAPDLSHLRGNIHPEWLVSWLDHHRPARVDGNDSPVGLMPDFDLDTEEATALASYLISQSEPAPRRRPLGKRWDATQLDEQINAGRKLFDSLGCLACHQRDGTGQAGLFAGRDLSHAGDKRPAEFFPPWLADPGSINAHHRMPVFDLSDQEIEQLSLFLSRLHEVTDDEEPSAIPDASDTELVARGKDLYQALRCASCHEDEPTAKIDIHDPQRFAETCGGEPNKRSGRPGYRLTEEQSRDVADYLATPVRPDALDARLIVTQQNCLACHDRHQDLGISTVLNKLVESHPEYASTVSELKPPSLNAVGDKLTAAAIAESIRQGGNPTRPYLQVRMPKFNLSSQHLAAAVEHFVHRDRIPEGWIAAAQELPETVVRVAAPRLVTSDGFGCTSCHQVGSVIPSTAQRNARGPKLSMLGARIRREWFLRWVRNPARTVSALEMPSIQLAVGGVLDEDVEKQLSAVWQILNQPGFEPPTPSPVRIVRHSGRDIDANALVFTDVVRTPAKTVIKPWVIGLPNRQTMMWDLESARLAQWWSGDALRQHTEGKTWYWEPGGPIQFDVASEESEWSLQMGEVSVVPLVGNQFRTEVESWRHRNGGVEFAYRLVFDMSSANTEPITVRISEFIVPWVQTDVGRSGVRRSISVSELPDDATLTLQLVSEAAFNDALLAGVRRLIVTHPLPVSISIDGESGSRFDELGRVHLTGPESGEQISLDLVYASDLPVDTIPSFAPRLRSRTVTELDVVPGFRGQRLGFVREWMPTAMAWDDSGDLYVASLKGRVWKVTDHDGDGLEDTATVFSDELSAPFGIAAHADGIDVVHKSGLLRLVDSNQDDFADQVQLLASGWGHTADYHDWAVGLPQDSAGAYYVALSCQQDERSLAASKFRGCVVKLVPRQPTPQDPRRFTVELVSGGHRFPVGIARNQAGELFVTDNQGNYNPFNELNHVQTGARYGFINKWEAERGFRSDFLPPAINIPHPWTRSVNGICFLESAGGDGRAFGPFEGHLVGCEYDTQRLIRMSLQTVGDTVQGAAYPFSFDEPPTGEPLLGPLACAVSPDNALYVGCIRDSGWGGANNVGTLARFDFDAESLPAGIAEVRAVANGFEVQFTKAVDTVKAVKIDAYRLTSYRRTSTPAYGGSDQDRRVESISRVKLLDPQIVSIQLDDMRPGFVYQLNLENLSENNELFFPAEAHYTLNAVPEE